MNLSMNEDGTNTKKQNMLGYLEVRQRVTERSSLLCSCLSKIFRVSDMVVSVECQKIQVYEHWFSVISVEAREWLKQLSLILSKSVKGIQIKYSSFVNQTSALNVSTTREELPLQFKDQLIASGFYLKSKSKPSQSQVKQSQVKK